MTTGTRFAKWDIGLFIAVYVAGAIMMFNTVRRSLNAIPGTA